MIEEEKRYCGLTWSEIDAMQQGGYRPQTVSGPVNPDEIRRDMERFGIPVAEETAELAGIDMVACGYRLNGSTWEKQP